MSLVIHQAAQLPAVFTGLSGDEFSEFTGGVQSGFPIISIRGKVWRIRKGGKEENYLDASGDAVATVEAVLVRSNPHPSKVFYSSSFEEGSTEAPTCWSSNGDKPDPEVQTPVSKTCAACPNNVWGSRITPQGSKSRACADVRRMAVVFASDLTENGAEATPFLLRVPPASLNPLKDYAEGLKNRGMYPFSLVTKLGFDPTTSHPKLTFRPVRIVTEEEAEAIMALRDNDIVRRILAESTEFVAAGTPEDGDEPGTPTAPAAPAPAAASRPAAAKKLKPVEEEDVGEEAEEAAPAPAPTPTPAAPKPARAAKPAAPKPAAAAPAPAAPKPAATKAGGESFDSMLDSILGKK